MSYALSTPVFRVTKVVDAMAIGMFVPESPRWLGKFDAQSAIEVLRELSLIVALS
jgi:hypothetical protein